MVQMSEQLLVHNQVSRRTRFFSVSFLFAHRLIKSLRRSNDRIDFQDFHSEICCYSMSPSLGVSFVLISSGFHLPFNMQLTWYI